MIVFYIQISIFFLTIYIYIKCFQLLITRTVESNWRFLFVNFYFNQIDGIRLNWIWLFIALDYIEWPPRSKEYVYVPHSTYFAFERIFMHMARPTIKSEPWSESKELQHQSWILISFGNYYVTQYDIRIVNILWVRENN